MDSNTGVGMELRAGTEADAAAAATLHAEQIVEGFLSFLGPAFLRRLYRRVARSPESFLLVVDDGPTSVGFLAGSTDVRGLYRAFLWHDGPAAVLACSGRLIRSWQRVLETLRHGGGGSGEGAELLAVAVHSAVQGRGVGTLLVDGFLTEMARRKQDAAHVIVGANNGAAIALYGRAGFHMVERFTLHAGTDSLLMQWTARPGPNP
jgi:ribosomal protein S18 acetylase RimI-like enzyme